MQMTWGPHFEKCLQLLPSPFSSTMQLTFLSTVGFLQIFMLSPLLSLQAFSKAKLFIFYTNFHLHANESQDYISNANFQTYI